jgi:acyl carrier protein
MPTTQDILAMIRDVLQKEHDIGDRAVTVDTPIADLGIDSLSMIELIFHLEDKLGINVSEGLQRVPPKRIGEVVDLVMQHLPQTSSAAQG